MCDVSGHGVGPALLATRFSSEVRHLVMEQLPPVEIVRALNAFIWQHFRTTDLFISFIAAQFDLAQGVLVFCGAGHPAPLLIRRGSGEVEVLQSQNMVIGVVEQCLFDVPQDTRTIDPGDRLLFYTDGVIETTDSAGNMLGTKGLSDLARFTCAGTLSDTADCILQRTAALCDGPPHDDMTLIVAELKPRHGESISAPENHYCHASND